MRLYDQNCELGEFALAIMIDRRRQSRAGRSRTEFPKTGLSNGLLGVALVYGERLIKGRKLTGFAAEEEDARAYDKIAPFELEGALKAAGAVFEEASIFQSRVVVDGPLSTGQKPPQRAFGEAVVKGARG